MYQKVRKSLYVSKGLFPDIAKFADFRRKNTDDSRTQSLCQVIHIFFGSSLDKVQLCLVSSL